MFHSMMTDISLQLLVITLVTGMLKSLLSVFIRGVPKRPRKLASPVTGKLFSQVIGVFFNVYYPPFLFCCIATAYNHRMDKKLKHFKKFITLLYDDSLMHDLLKCSVLYLKCDDI